MRKFLVSVAALAASLSVLPASANPQVQVYDTAAFGYGVGNTYLYFDANFVRTLQNPQGTYSGCGFMFGSGFAYFCGFQLKLEPGGLTGTISGVLRQGNTIVGQADIDLIASYVSFLPIPSVTAGFLPASQTVVAGARLCREYVTNGEVVTTVGTLTIIDVVMVACSGAGANAVL